MEMRGLKEIRKKKNINQLKLAFDLAISREAISHYENGNRNPSLEMLIALSDYFNVSIDYLIKGEEFQKKQQTRLCEAENELPPKRVKAILFRYI